VPRISKFQNQQLVLDRARVRSRRVVVAPSRRVATHCGMYPWLPAYCVAPAKSLIARASSSSAARAARRRASAAHRAQSRTGFEASIRVVGRRDVSARARSSSSG